MAGRPQRRAKLAAASSVESGYDRTKREYGERDPGHRLLMEAQGLVGEVQWAFERLAQVAAKMSPKHRAVLMEALEVEETELSASPEQWFEASHYLTTFWPEYLSAAIANFETEEYYDEDEGDDD